MKNPRLIFGTLGLGILSLIGLIWVSPIWIFGMWIGILTGALVLYRPRWGFLLLVAALPFEYLGSVDAFGITLRASQILLIATACSAFMHAWIRPRQGSWSSPNATDFWIGLLLLAGALSLTNSVNIERSFLVWGFIAFTSLLAWVTPAIITSKKILQQVLTVLFGITLVVCAFGLFQFIGDIIGLPPSITGLREQYTKAVLGFPRLQSTALEPLYFASFLLTPISVALSLLYSGKSKIASWLLWSVVGLGIVAVILTVARGGYIALAIALLSVSSWWFYKLLTPSRWITTISSMIVIGLVSVIVLQMTDAGSAFITHTLRLFEGASYVERIETFTQARQQFVEHPWIGIGIGHFGPSVASHPFLRPETGWAIVNNVYLEVAAEMGMIGLVAWLGLLGSLMVVSISTIRKMPSTSFERAVLIGLFSALLGIAVQYLTFSTLFIMHIWFLFGMILAVIALSRHPSHSSSTL